MNIRFITKDGSLIQNRKTSPDYYFLDKNCSKPDTEFLEYSLTKDANEKGVKVLSYTVSKDLIEATVDWK